MGSGPEFVTQMRDRKRRAKGQQEGAEMPNSPRSVRDRGKRTRGKPAPDGAVERTDKARVQARWGQLPPYLQYLFKRRGTPKLPSKYARFRDAFHKNVDRHKRRR